MKVGDYVRTKDGYIDKIKAIDEERHQRRNDDEEKLYKIYQLNKEYYDDEFDETCDWVFEDFIIKSSPNIIDLIEVGDYINGEKVLFITKNGNTRLEVVCSDGESMLGWRSYKEKEFKSIVTKEQFERCEYKCV